MIHTLQPLYCAYCINETIPISGLIIKLFKGSVYLAADTRLTLRSLFVRI